MHCVLHVPHWPGFRFHGAIDDFVSDYLVHHYPVLHNGGCNQTDHPKLAAETKYPHYGVQYSRNVYPAVRMRLCSYSNLVVPDFAEPGERPRAHGHCGGNGTGMLRSDTYAVALQADNTSYSVTCLTVPAVSAAGIHPLDTFLQSFYYQLMATKQAHSKTPSSTSSTPKSTGIPKWVIIVIVVVAVLYALFYIGGMIIGNAVKTKMGLQNVQMSEDGKSFAIQGKNGEMMQVGENAQLPADFPKNMPIYPGAKIQTSVGSKDGMSVTFLVENTGVEKVRAWYTEELAKTGWENRLEKIDGGPFSVINDTHHAVILVLGEDNKVSITINASKNDK
jgi:hypothetical protein